MPHTPDRTRHPRDHRSDANPARGRSRTSRTAFGVAVATVIGLAGSGLAVAGATPHHPSAKHHPQPRNQPPIIATVFSPGRGDVSGSAGAGFIVDVSLDARKPHFNGLLSTAAGYKPFFNDPMAPTFHPGPDPGAPGLVVLLSTTPNKPGTPLQGPNTNLAGLFQINGVATVHGTAETWNTWQPGKPIFGTGPSILTVYVVAGTAPTVIPATGLNAISNVVHVPFTITS